MINTNLYVFQVLLLIHKTNKTLQNYRVSAFTLKRRLFYMENRDSIFCKTDGVIFSRKTINLFLLLHCVYNVDLVHISVKIINAVTIFTGIFKKVYCCIVL